MCAARCGCIGLHIMAGRKVPIVQVEIVSPVFAERVEADVSVAVNAVRDLVYGARSCVWRVTLCAARGS